MDCFLSSPKLLFFTQRGSPQHSLSEHFGSYSPSRSSEIHSHATLSQRNWDFPLCVTQRYNLVICVFIEEIKGLSEGDIRDVNSITNEALSASLYITPQCSLHAAFLVTACSFCLSPFSLFFTHTLVL